MGIKRLLHKTIKGLDNKKYQSVHVVIRFIKNSLIGIKAMTGTYNLLSGRKKKNYVNSILYLYQKHICC